MSARAGRVAAVSGGARGIGRATAAALLGDGAFVAIGDLDRMATEGAAAELGAGCIGLQLDVRDRACFARFLGETVQRLGDLDVLVNNAGVMQLSRFVEEDEAGADLMIDVNLRGALTGTQLALRSMLPRGTGHIVIVASSAGKVGIPGGATYCATKRSSD